MASFSAASKEKLLTCHPDLQRLFNRVVERRDCTIISGRRGEPEQNELFRTGFSQMKYPWSAHNYKPSKGVDVMSYHECEPHIRWDDIESTYNFIGYVQGMADLMDIEIRSGADWDNDNDFHDQSFIDAAHFELVNA
jgi:peptidoglycan L-alanyl-D-glutamate endopeptidase CwlK